MQATTGLVTDNEFFCAERRDRILFVRGKPHLTRHAGDLKKIDVFLDHIEIIARTNEVDVLTFIGSQEKSDGNEILGFFESLLRSPRENFLLERLLNLVNTYTASLAGLNKVTIYADSGRISALHLCRALAFDFRIISENAVFENTFADLGMIPKGGGGYFLSRLVGVSKAFQVLQWPRFTAEEALSLGIVDKIVPEEKLEEEALAFANHYREPQMAAMLAIRKLLKSDLSALRRSLETEDLLLLNRVKSPAFRTALEARKASDDGGSH
jgi:2-(1,2-epoxy-1,2-dihydrophenyl)acetyl-CoA isomerase